MTPGALAEPFLRALGSAGEPGADPAASRAFQRLALALVALTTLPFMASALNGVHGDIYFYWETSLLECEFRSPRA